VEQVTPGLPLYVICRAWRLRGRLDVGALERAVAAVVGRHESLRTRFGDEAGEPFQVVDDAPAFSLRLADVSDHPPANREAGMQRVLDEAARRPFDLARDLMLRAVLVRLAVEDHVLLLQLHHIAADGWSLGILLGELSASYAAQLEGRDAGLPELPIQYADFASWQRKWLAGERLERLVSYWEPQLEGAPPQLQLPADRPRPPETTFAGARCPVAVSAEVTAVLKALAARNRCSLFMVLLAGFAAWLRAETGREDVAVATPVAGRTRVETEA